MGIFTFFVWLATIVSLAALITACFTLMVSHAKIDIGIEVEARTLGNNLGFFIVAVHPHSPLNGVAKVHDQLVAVGRTKIVLITHQEVRRCMRNHLFHPAGEVVLVELRRPGVGASKHEVVWGPKLRGQASLVD